MHASALQSILEHLRKLTDPARVRDLSDGDLLERFRLHREEAAFTLLVQRHGPMVLAVCRRILGNAHDSRACPQCRRHPQATIGGRLVAYTATLMLLATMGFAAPGTWIAASPMPSAQQKAPPPQSIDNRDEKRPAPMRKPRLDCFGDPLPPGARTRLGTIRLRHGGNISQYAFSPDGKVLAAASCDNMNTVSLWDVATGRELRSLELATSGRGGVAFSPDGKILATGSGFWVRPWDTATWKELPRWSPKADKDGKPFDVGKLFFSPDGKSLASIGKTRANQEAVNTVVFLDTTSGRELHRLNGRKMYGSPSIAFAPDSKTWAYVDRHDKTIAHYDVRRGKELRRFAGHTRAARTVAFSPDGKTLASTDDEGALRFWDTATGKLLPQQGHFQVRSNLTYFPDGKRLLGWRGVPLRYDIAAGKEIPTPGPRWNGESIVLLSPDGTRLAWANEQNALHLWDAATFKPIRPETSHERPIDSIAFSADSRVVVSAAGEDGLVRRWDAATGRALPPFREVRDFVHALAYSPDGRVLAVGTGGHGGAIWLLDATTGKRLRTLVSPKGSVASLTFSADGRSLLCGQLGEKIRLWDVATGKVLKTFPGGSFFGRAIALSPDGKIIAGGNGIHSRGRVHLWEAAAGKEVRTLQTPDGDEAYVLAFSPDGKTLASSGYGRAVMLWNAATGKLLWQSKGHQDWVSFLSFSPDGRTLASGGKDGAVFLWEAETGKERWHFDKHRYAVGSGAFSRDGKLLATGSNDTSILIWDLAAAAGTPRPSPLSAKELEALWADLVGGDAAKAFQAIHRFAAAPGQALPFLREHLKSVPALDRKRVRQLVERLDSDDFQERQKATEELNKQADAVLGLLRQILAKEKPSLEVRKRLQQVLEDIELELHRAVRAVEVLEWIATPEAVRLLGELANGAADARLTHEAAAAKRRLVR